MPRRGIPACQPYCHPPPSEPQPPQPYPARTPESESNCHPFQGPLSSSRADSRSYSARGVQLFRTQRALFSRLTRNTPVPSLPGRQDGRCQTSESQPHCKIPCLFAQIFAPDPREILVGRRRRPLARRASSASPCVTKAPHAQKGEMRKTELWIARRGGAPTVRGNTSRRRVLGGSIVSSLRVSAAPGDT